MEEVVMPTKTSAAKPSESSSSNKPVILKDWNEMARYLAKKLKPVAHGPKGQPIYDDEEVKALNIQLAQPS